MGNSEFKQLEDNIKSKNIFSGMGNSGLKQHCETAKKTGVLKISQLKLHEFPLLMKTLEGSLRTLDISDNKFSTLPDDIKNFKLLRHLNVNKNRLCNLPECLNELTKLESLNACTNSLTSLPQSLSTLVNLKQVYLSENNLKVFPLVFCGLKHLDILDISKNKINSIPSEVINLYVTELNMNQNQVSTISEDIAGCPRLKTLRLEENCLQINAIHPKILKESKISVLTVEGNLFEMKQFTEVSGYEDYMERYTAVKKKMF